MNVNTDRLRDMRYSLESAENITHELRSRNIGSNETIRDMIDEMLLHIESAQVCVKHLNTFLAEK